MLLYATPPDWFAAATADLGGLLSDHLHAERKAAENALLLLRKYPHDRLFVETLARLAHEETSHVVQVSLSMQELGLAPRSDISNPYTRQLFTLMRQGEPARKVDSLLVAALIEARSHERLRLLAAGFAALGAKGGAFAERFTKLADFYTVLANAEERHAESFVALAEREDSQHAVADRLTALALSEATIVAALPMGPRVH